MTDDKERDDSVASLFLSEYVYIRVKSKQTLMDKIFECLHCSSVYYIEGPAYSCPAASTLPSEL